MALWLAADGDGEIHIFNKKPYWVKSDKIWETDKPFCTYSIGSTKFKFWKNVIKPGEAFKLVNWNKMRPKKIIRRKID